ncbi:hypothetical protein [Polynucleobacter sp. AP-RePozz3-80-G7]|uniref:hypothetical protein n=1 Tax=Polynucleobacter sp. AP-RePozz3-80-G7 TaxID=2689105 RepID=UPI001C0B50C8|nr:hypothetical protein [Polynucleobacter sp. AP-RePozz3-80-G7]MBU3640009.1 hypothetical protein [Polynucleobacter sp. AP-RePozz3-80-G7]
MNPTKETIDLVKTAQSVPDDLIKSFVQPNSATTGLQAYNLEAPAKKLYPLLTPLRNSIPRIGGGFAIQANWKAITNINVANVRAGVSEGKRGGVISHSTSEYMAAFRGFGLENNVTFEANYASKNYEDLKALAVQQSLESTMIQEERTILGGNTSVSLGTTPTPTLSAGTGGTLAAATYSVIAVALGLQAYLDTVGVNNGSIGSYFNAATAQVPGQIVRTNADGTTDTFGGGSARKSASATVNTSGSAGSITASVAQVNGAVGYAWFVGEAGSEKLVAVTSINSAVITAAASAGAQTAASLADSDNSTSALDFDGLLTQAFKPNSGAYIYNMATGTAGAGTGLTADGAGGIAEFEQAFVQFYNRYRLSPTVIYVSAQELINITKKVIGNGGAPLLRMTTDAVNPGNLQAGLRVAEYLNKVTGTKIPVVIHPNMPAGTVFFHTEKLPYPTSNVGNVVQMLMRQDYYQLEWPVKTRKYEYGVYADGVLQHYAPFAMGVITNIANA